MRSINTSLVAVLPVASLLFVGTYLLGGLVLRDFALALFVGLTVGAYSSIFVATPVLAWLKEREPRYRALRARAEADLARRPAPSVVPVTSVEPAVSAPVAAFDEIDAVEEIPETQDVPATATSSAKAAPSSTPTPTGPRSAPPATRGSANPRPRQQRGRKRR
jgi:preprotein translocase subunit SecF